MSLAREVPPDRDEQAAAWCMRLADGKLPRDVEVEFETWSADPDNAKAFEEATSVWATAEAAANIPEVIQLRRAALENFTRTNRRRWTMSLPGRGVWRGLAAAVVVAIVVGCALLYQNLPQTEVYRTNIGERRVVALADDSKISLDADTEVAVSLKRNRRDLVLVHGRAKFDVAKDPLRPFTVAAGNRIVVATGTSFSVELVNNAVHVLLYSGRVAVLDRKDRRTLSQEWSRGGGSLAAAGNLILEPGHELVAESEGPLTGKVKPADPVLSLSWEAGQLAFDNEPLASVVEQSNRYSFQKLVIGDPSLAQLPVNGVFTAGDTVALAAGISALHEGVKVERSPGRITLVLN